MINKATHIYDDISGAVREPHIGLLGGSSGIIWFYLLLFEKVQDENILSRIQMDLEHAIAEAHGLDYSWGYGFAGFAWMLMLLDEKGLIDINDKSIIDLDELDEFIFQSIIEDANNYDCFTGFIGKGLYFLKRNNSLVADKALKQIIKQLEQYKIDSNTGVYWLDAGTDKKTLSMNLGLAHGVPGILNFLCMVYMKLPNENTKTIIRQSSKWILNQKQLIDNDAHFPYVILQETKQTFPDKLPGRLGWCYGDLGIACSLISAGKVLDDDSLYNTGIEIASRMAKRRDAHECQIVDASICHGSAGLSCMFNWLYKHTELQIFKSASLHWQRDTIERLSFESGIGGYLYWSGSPTSASGNYEKVFGILEGAAGVGISLLACNGDTRNQLNVNILLLLPDITRL